MNKKGQFKIYLMIGNILIIAFILFLYLIYVNTIFLTFKILGTRLWFLIIISLTISAILLIMAIDLFKKWFQQEDIFLSDLPFLFGIMFLLIGYGKFIDLLNAFTYFTLNPDDTLLLIKVRFFIIIFSMASMLFLSIWMYQFKISLKDKYLNSKIRDENYRTKISRNLVVLICSIETFFVIYSPNIVVISFLLPIFTIPSMLIIVWLFYFSWKNNSLQQVNSKILFIGFIYMLISQLIRPMFYIIIPDKLLYIIYSELISLTAWLIIIYGFLNKPSKNISLRI